MFDFMLHHSADSSVEVLATLTSDVGRILSKLHTVQPNGNINLHIGIRIAHVCSCLKECLFFVLQCALVLVATANHKLNSVGCFLLSVC